MIILAIDTSCDDTCIAIIEAQSSNLKIRSNVISSQIKIHRKYGGVFPALAKREHQKNLIPVLKNALKKAKNLKKQKKAKKIDLDILKKILLRDDLLFQKIKLFLENYQKPNIDFIAITIGPGLEPCLWTGINFAKALSFFWQKPLVPVNHLEGHIFANWLKPIRSNSKIKMQNAKTAFPAIALIASGGHTELVFVKKIKQYKLLGETLDDAAGECFDKIAKLLGLFYPGGPEIEKIAKNSNPETYNLPSPMIFTKDYNFSFSGLKTAVLYLTKKLKRKELKKYKTKANIAASAQKAIIDVLISKTIRAAKEKKVKTIILGGGVAANNELKKQFKSKVKISREATGSGKIAKEQNSKFKVLVPPKIFCTDNAAMIAIAGYFNFQNKISPKNLKNLYKLKAKSNLNF